MIRSIYRGIAARTELLLDRDMPNPTGSELTPSVQPRSGSLLSFENVAMEYPGPPPVRALVEFDLHIERGNYVTVVGPSGSGKSTFLNIAGLLDRPTSGRVVVDGVDAATLSEAQRSALRGKFVGFVFQAYHLMPNRTALENVMLAGLYRGVPRQQRLDMAVEQLQRVGLSHRMESKTSQLSGGEKQRVAIARAIAGEPNMLLCDEPTGNLDSGSAKAVLELLDLLHADGMTVVVITHDHEVASRGDMQIRIRDGVLDAAPR